MNKKDRENQNTLVFLLVSAFKKLLSPRMIVIEHSFGDGLFCHEAAWESITELEIRSLENQMREWISSKTKLTVEKSTKQNVIQELYKINSRSKVELVERWESDTIPIVKFGEYWDIMVEPFNLGLDNLGVFKLQKYNDGFLIRFGKEIIPPFKDRPNLFSIIEEHEQWGSILGVSTIRKLNKQIRNDEIRELIWIAEGLHEKKISNIADSLVGGFPERKIVTIAGPSSSGKTTFAKRLGIQMRVNGFNSVQISMDDYFVNRKDLIPDKDGKYDFESIDALDVELLSNRIDSLLNGNPIPKRKFDFVTGSGSDKDEMIQLGEWDYVVLEGIHGLNPILTNKIGIDRMKRIYISAITQMNIDANHRVSTSDNRLLRRIIRDFKFRGYSAEQTLDRWSSVRRGEDLNIFPFQEEADCMFNSSLVYELPVLAKFTMPLLIKALDNPSLADEATRLKTFLSFFETVDEEMVPGISILREFIGDSEFNY